MQQNTLTTYIPAGLSALVIIGLFILAAMRVIDFQTAMGIIGVILAGWGINGLVIKQSATIQAMTARRPMASSAYAPRIPRRTTPEGEDEHA